MPVLVLVLGDDNDGDANDEADDGQKGTTLKKLLVVME